MNDVCVVGMGYVGLTLAAILAERGFNVSGVETQESVVNSINRCEPLFYEAGLASALRRYLGSNLTVSQHMPIQQQDAFIICVGTPWDKVRGRPVMDHVVQATRQVAESYSDGALVVLRSTVPPGTSRHVVLPILHEKVANVLLAYCPERTAEGAALRELRSLPQIIGGISQESVDKAQEIFRKVTHTSIEVSSIEGAELIKLIDNSYRDMNFAFANEVAASCEIIGADAVEIIKAANTGYSRTQVAVPGFVGGVCLSKDPHIFSYWASQWGLQLRLVAGSRAINEGLVEHAYRRIEASMTSLGKRLQASNVLVAGLAFKGEPETNDVRDSSAIPLVKILESHGCHLFGHDFVVAPEVIRELGLTPVSLEEGFQGADCAIFMNNHRAYYRLDIAHLASLMNRPALVWDGWRIFDPREIEQLGGVLYGGLGLG